MLLCFSFGFYMFVVVTKKVAHKSQIKTHEADIMKLLERIVLLHCCDNSDSFSPIFLKREDLDSQLFYISFYLFLHCFVPG